MTFAGWSQIVIFLAVLTALTPLAGGYMARVYQGQPVALSRLGGPFERLLYRLLRVTPHEEQEWKAYARSVLAFSLASWVFLYIVLRTQSVDPLNTQGFASGPADLTFNTASSFVSNTSWQYYAGETTLSYFSQMLGITVASFTSCAVGMAVAVALIRGLVRRETRLLGNFWVDLTRSLLYVLVPLSVLGGLFLVSQGALQNLSRYLSADGLTHLQQTIAMGPVGSQEVIKLLSGDGGGFFNTNSAHPFENPTGLTNFVEALLMLLIPAALTYTFGRMVGNRRQGWALYAAMLALFVAGVAIIYAAEAHGSPAMHAAGLHGANLQDKEQRFGTASSALFAETGTASGDGAVNSGLEAYTGIGSAVAMSNIMTGEVIFGGPGSGLFGMLLLVVLGVFIAGLMVGRTPEYLGKKLGMREVKLAALGTVFVPTLVLVMTAIANATPAGRQSLSNKAPLGFSESLYAYLSQANNNGSAFAGYAGFVQPAAGNVGSHGIAFADIAGGLVMTFGRFVPILAVLALAGTLASRRATPVGLGTLRTDTPTFVIFVIGFVIIFALLNFLAALCLGPLAQALTSHLY
ncbi:MAG TPA: potassium-transporting ATPase subunit KdpA [Solirubrobacteraceae bacterium]|jgi:K+-transporting ATPase ATPase A chain|nr:potassium-transporting ATPase subunit KdpA [Solirubrobacteraceae bacterium]